MTKNGISGAGTVILVGGTDPSGGAGLAADIKSTAAMGVHGCPVVSAVTVQSAGRMHYWKAVESNFLHDQLMTAAGDGRVSGIKTGMLGSLENVRVLSDFIRGELRNVPYVLDPVAASGSGSTLMEEGMTAEISRRLLPVCTLCTPNLPEAEMLSGVERIVDSDGMIEAGRAIISKGAGAVLVKGGHLPEDPLDVLLTADECRVFRSGRITLDNVHGTGCTLAASCVALMSEGLPLAEAVAVARKYVRRAISRRMKRSSGYLPGHFPMSAPAPERLDGESFYLPPAYCSLCGSSMVKSPGETGHFHCPECGFLHYMNPLPAVALVVRDGDRILLVRRGISPGKGLLCLPGGFMETGETPEECGMRELWEETGLKAAAVRLLELENDVTAYGSILLVVLEVMEFEGTPSPGDDASEIIWMKPREVPGLAFRAHNRILEEIIAGENDE